MNTAVAVNAFDVPMCGVVAASIAWLRSLEPSAVFTRFL
jgi:hypothetical protein